MFTLWRCQIWLWSSVLKLPWFLLPVENSLRIHFWCICVLSEFISSEVEETTNLFEEHWIGQLVLVSPFSSWTRPRGFLSRRTHYFFFDGFRLCIEVPWTLHWCYRPDRKTEMLPEPAFNIASDGLCDGVGTNLEIRPWKNGKSRIFVFFLFSKQIWTRSAAVSSCSFIWGKISRPWRFHDNSTERFTLTTILTLQIAPKNKVNELNCKKSASDKYETQVSLIVPNCPGSTEQTWQLTIKVLFLKLSLEDQFN